MAKAYWVNSIRSVSDPGKLEAYARLAGPALQSHGGRFLARGLPSRVFEAGLMQRTVVIEFDSVQRAVEAYQSEGSRDWSDARLRGYSKQVQSHRNGHRRGPGAGRLFQR